MNVERLLEVAMSSVDSEMGGALCLSKGGWEGWLQCEMWRTISLVDAQSVEREVPYPDGGGARCDLVVSARPDREEPALWIELKAFGAFREGDEHAFLDLVALDLQKLDQTPSKARAVLLFVVPKAIGVELREALQDRGWNLDYEESANAAYFGRVFDQP